MTDQKYNRPRIKQIIIIYNYFTGKLREFYFTKGSQDQFCLQNIQTKLVEGTRG